MRRLVAGFMFLVLAFPVLAQEEIDEIVDTRDVWNEAIADANLPIKLLVLFIFVVALVAMFSMRMPMVEDIRKRAWEKISQETAAKFQQSRMSIEARVVRYAGNSRNYAIALRNAIMNMGVRDPKE